MSRELERVENGRPLPGWVMVCDQADCKTRSDVRQKQADLPLVEFVDAGWFVARTYGDYCPACVNRAGGVDVLMRSTHGPNAPHPVQLMAGARS